MFILYGHAYGGDSKSVILNFIIHISFNNENNTVKRGIRSVTINNYNNLTS